MSFKIVNTEPSQADEREPKADERQAEDQQKQEDRPPEPERRDR